MRAKEFILEHRNRIPPVVMVGDVEYAVMPETRSVKGRASGAAMVKQAARGMPVDPYSHTDVTDYKIVRKQDRRYIATVERMPNGSFRSGRIMGRTIEEVVQRLVGVR